MSHTVWVLVLYFRNVFLFKEFTMFLRHLIVLIACVASSNAFADSIDINLRDTSAQLQYSAAAGHSTLGKSELHFGYLYTSKTNHYADFGLRVKDEVSPNVPGLAVGVGIKGMLGKVGSNSASAAALGGLVRYAPLTVPRLGLAGQAYWSPSILTFGDADRTLETGLRVEYEIIPQAAVYVGYRKIKIGLKNAGDATLEEGAHVGVRMSF
jgi:hypothetical protein